MTRIFAVSNWTLMNPQRIAVAALAGLVLAAPLAEADQAPTYDRVSFSVESNADVANDTLVVDLFSQQERTSASDAAEVVNKDMKWALDKAKAQASVDTKTLNYSTMPVYNDTRIKSWRVQQTLRLESKDTEALSKLLGVLQERLSIQSSSHQLSPEARKAQEDQLIGQALKNFQERAKLVVEAMNAKQYQVVSMNVSSNGGGLEQYQDVRMVSAAKMSAAPSFEGGNARLTVTVNGEIELMR